MADYSYLTTQALYEATRLFESPPVQAPSSYSVFDFASYNPDNFSGSFADVDTFNTFSPDANLEPDVMASSTPCFPDFLESAIPDPVFVSSFASSDPLEEWLAFQIDAQSYNVALHRAVDYSSGSDQETSSSVDNSPVATSRSNAPRTRSLKRKVVDSDWEEDDCSDCSSDYIPRLPPKRAAPSRKATKAPLPEHLQPIKVQAATHHRCPMPGCSVSLEAKDSAWRGHFKREHHTELCLTPGCVGTCKARCPLPIPGCKSCEKAGGAMTIESVGRHLLNIHIKVAFRCPLCGLQNEWRESACVRHIRRCMEKRQKGKKRARC